MAGVCLLVRLAGVDGWCGCLVYLAGCYSCGPLACVPGWLVWPGVAVWCIWLVWLASVYV
jgi:uncharacterized membrane protein